ncbi:hypothetical protein MPH_14164, partial [Macrophomina phaseolina MS6]
QQPSIESIYHEGRITLAIEAINRDQIQSERRAASTFKCAHKTLNRRRAGTTARRDCEPNCKKLTKFEELAIVEHILDLDSRGFPPTKEAVRDMANKLLDERGGKPVGKNWPDNFIKRTPELKTQQSRSYDHQRALNEDSRVISDWFKLVQSIKAKYGILDKDS